MDGHIACIEAKMNAWRNLVGKPEGKGPLGKSGHSWECNITVDLKKQNGRAETGFTWLKIGTNCGIL
jgi:hypothetical protein